MVGGKVGGWVERREEEWVGRGLGGRGGGERLRVGRKGRGRERKGEGGRGRREGGGGGVEREKMLRSTHHSVRQNGSGVALRQRGRADAVSAAAHRPRRRRLATQAATRQRVEIAVVPAAGQASVWFTATVEALSSQASNLDLVLFGGADC